MRNEAKFALQMIGGIVSVWIAVVGNAAQVPAKCKQTLSASDKVLALNEIQNVMGLYAHLGHLRGENTLRELFAMKQPDVFWKTPLGPTGPEEMEKRFLQPGEAARGEVPGQLHVHSMFTPVIEVAADGRTAQGVWDSFGPSIANGDAVGGWLWVKYGVDFIKEDGRWKIWHMQVFGLFSTPYDKSITQTARERAAADNSQRESGATGGPGQTWTGPAGGLWSYDGKTAPRGPNLPEPYCTFDAAKSSAIYGKYDNWSATERK